MTTMQSRHNPITPSPLSQSTSAVHLQTAHPEIQLPRKLSKRRTQSASDHQPSEHDRKVASAPATPVDHVVIAPSSEFLPLDSTSLPKRMSVAPAPLFSSMQPTPKKEKRGSMLDRLVKKFSLLRKPTGEQVPASEWWQHADNRDTKGYGEPRQDGGQSSPHKSHRESSIKRVPPPLASSPEKETPTTTSAVTAPAEETDKASLHSVETPYPMGRLTVANPDLPEVEPSATETPMVDAAPLPPEKPKESIHKREPSSGELLSQSQAEAQPVVSDRMLRLDKPLPPPQLATPELTQLRLSDVQAAQAFERALSPPSPVEPPKNLAREPDQVPQQEPQEPKEAPSPPEINQVHNGSISLDHNAVSPVNVQTQHVSSPEQSQQKEPEERSNKITPQVIAATSSPDRLPDPTVSKRSEQSTAPRVSPERDSSQRVTSRVQSSKSKKSDSPSTVRNYSLDHATNGQSPTAPPPSRDERNLAPEPSTSKHESPKPSRSHSRLKSAPMQIPFPTAQQMLTPHGSDRRPVSREYEGSPLSASSVLANPPTPYDHRLSIAMSDAPTLPSKDADEIKELPKHRPVNPPQSRQTETFTLVRSLSGHVYASSQTIMAAGQQWEVVESVEVKGKKDKSSSRHKEQPHKSREEDRRSKDHSYRKRDSQHKSDEQELRRRDRDDRRSRDYEHRSKDDDERLLKDEQRSRDYERTSRDYDRRLKEEQRAREYERMVKDHDRRYEGRSREEPRVERASKEDQRSRDYERSFKDHGNGHKEEQRPKDLTRASRSYEQRSRDDARVANHESRYKDHEVRSRDDQKSKHHEKRPREQDHRSKGYEGMSREYEQTPRIEDARSKSNDHSFRSETKDTKVKIDVENEYHRSSHRVSKQSGQHADDYTKSNGHSSSRYCEERPQEGNSRNRADHRDRRSDKRRSAHDSSSLSNHASSVSKATVGDDEVPVSDPPTLRLERNPSITARPTSELPSAAEMNAVRAKESWEIERLWKARSMYGIEPNGNANTIIPDSSSSSSKSDDAPTHSAVYGSSHTAYVVQTPFQTSGHQIYHSMPTAPPPIIYSSPASIPSIPDSISSYEPYDHVYRSVPSPPEYARSPPFTRPPLSNPLPEPPRETPLDLKGLKMTRQSNRHSKDSWTKYNGVTTAH